MATRKVSRPTIASLTEDNAKLHADDEIVKE